MVGVWYIKCSVSNFFLFGFCIQKLEVITFVVVILDLDRCKYLDRCDSLNLYYFRLILLILMVSTSLLTYCINVHNFVPVEIFSPKKKLHVSKRTSNLNFTV